MMVKKVMLFLLCAAAPSFAQTHFTFTSSTGLYATIAVPAAIAPTIDGTPIAVGDEVGVFTPAGLCVGASVWTGATIPLIVWPDNTLTPSVDGIAPGEIMSFRVWQKATLKEFASVTATYSSHYAVDGRFALNGLFELASLTAVTPIPSVPTLLTPVHQAVNVPTATTLYWQTAANAVSYNLQVSTDPLFSSFTTQASVTGTNKAVSGLSEGTTYYWRVLGVNNTGISAWSSVFQFTTLTTPPSPPVLLLPTNDAHDVSTTPSLEWAGVSGAVSYDVEIALDAAFSSVIYQYSVRPTSKTTSLLSEGTLYYWRVRSANTGGAGDWSAPAHFTTIVTVAPPPPAQPTLLLPANADTNETVTPSLQWGAVATASSYTVEVALDSLFAQMVVQTSVAGISKILSPLAEGTTYYWRVQSVNTVGISGWSSTFHFTTLVTPPPPPPAAPQLTSPANGAGSVPLTLVLVWGAVATADSYIVMCATDSLFSAIVFQMPVTGSVKTVSVPSEGTTYYWRVQSVNRGGAGAWSTVYMFRTLVTPPPGIPTLFSPTNGAVDVSLAPVLCWQPVGNAVAYTVMLSTDAAFTTIVSQSSDTGTTRTMPALSEGAVYFWRVRSVGVNGTSAWSGAFQFTTVVNPPAVPSPMTPANNAVDVPPAVTIRWARAKGAIQYLLQVAADTLFNQFVAISIVTDTTVTLEPLAKGTTYYWRVLCENAAGVSKFSPVYKFTVAGSATVPGGGVGVPDRFAVEQNFPNPFNPSTTIRFSLPDAQAVKVAVYDVLGREVAELMNGALPRGVFTATWNAAGAQSGMYVYRVTTGSYSAAKTMILLK